MDKPLIPSSSQTTPSSDDLPRSIDNGRVVLGPQSQRAENSVEANTEPTTSLSSVMITPIKSIVGESVVNTEGENLGKIEAIALDTNNNCVAYGVLSFGGFLGIGKKLFAIPWPALKLDLDKHRFILDVDKERLKFAPGFDKDNWPPMADLQWATNIHYYYNARPYWG